jgi:hypothetical protein
MRARMKRRQLYRRVTILAAVAGIVIVLVVGFYFALKESTANDYRIGKPVTAADLSALKQFSLPPYGSIPSATQLSYVQNYNGTAWSGKPRVVFVGADFCMYCAAERWPILLSLLRFGNFTGLEYMASSVTDGDYATFTFNNLTYTSKYFIFQPFEAEARNGSSLQTVPSNYSTIWQSYGTGFPFLDFGNRYIIPASLIDPSGLFDGKNWAQLENDIANGTATGTNIKGAANLITALICKLTGNQPGSVCGQSPITSLTLQPLAYSTNLSGGVVTLSLVQTSPSVPGAVFPRRGSA